MSEGNQADGGPDLDTQDGQDQGPVLDTSVAHSARVYVMMMVTCSFSIR